MNLKIDPEDFRYQPGKSPALSEFPHEIKLQYQSKGHYKDQIRDYRDVIHDYQYMMYAHDRYSLLCIFQGMDTAGKDGAIRNVFSGVNPAGVEIHSFKKPSDIELSHDWMWRTTKALPQRGRIGVFNRSYYEEVLVVKVHPKILHQYQHLPPELHADEEQVWKDRYQDIVNFEDFLHRNGTRVVKFFINISRDEQRDRLIDRIDEPEKNWKMSLGDVEERKFWNDYQNAYQDLLNATSTEQAPWYVIPGNDKKNARLTVAQVVMHHMSQLDMAFPEVTDEFRTELQEVRKLLLDD